MKKDFQQDNQVGTLQSSKIEDTLSSINPVVQEGAAMLEFPSKFLVEVPELGDGSEDGLTLSRRSVFTEKLPPATRAPLAPKRKRRELRRLGLFESLPV